MADKENSGGMEKQEGLKGKDWRGRDQNSILHQLRENCRKNAHQNEFKNEKMTLTKDKYPRLLVSRKTIILNNYFMFKGLEDRKTFLYT